MKVTAETGPTYYLTCRSREEGAALRVHNYSVHTVEDDDWGRLTRFLYAYVLFVPWSDHWVASVMREGQPWRHYDCDDRTATDLAGLDPSDDSHLDREEAIVRWACARYEAEEDLADEDFYDAAERAAIEHEPVSVWTRLRHPEV